MDIWSAIEELISIVEVGTGSSEKDDSRIVYLLDYLTLEMYGVNPDDGFDGEDIPENDYPAIRKAAEERKGSIFGISISLVRVHNPTN
ncbi:hypothetical protein [Gynuella sp.]|uniref:hypothetical protein n=1 Tax=Gynuella sp. TaxID=2969146 RepID=UPI003D0D3EE5